MNDSPLRQLTIVRFREFIREPEACILGVRVSDPHGGRTRDRVPQPPAGSTAGRSGHTGTTQAS